jgi:hypothetical protein
MACGLAGADGGAFGETMALMSALEATDRCFPDRETRQPTSIRTIPTDNAKVAAATISDKERARAETAHERFKALLETKPRAKGSLRRGAGRDQQPAGDASPAS